MTQLACIDPRIQTYEHAKRHGVTEGYYKSAPKDAVIFVIPGSRFLPAIAFYQLADERARRMCGTLTPAA